MSQQDSAKQAAAETAIETFVRDGMRLGLGSGSTSHLFVRALGRRVAAGLDIVGVPTSAATAKVAEEAGVPLTDLNALGGLDLTVDGADEVDGAFRMIKGGGACLLWEKIVAQASARMIAVVDESKLVELLGRFPLPVEVIPFGWRVTERQIAACLERWGARGREIRLRGGETEPLVTDSGNYILDCHCLEIGDPDSLAAALNGVPGVVESGLFTVEAAGLVIGRPDGSAEVRLKEG